MTSILEKFQTLFNICRLIGFTNGEGTIKAHVSVNLSLGDRPLAAQFQEISLDLRLVEAEHVGCMCRKIRSVIY